ncbi:MAG TPA: hypothetical protein VMH38_00715 [Thermoplasmata archaeon]|nr:hypothetical protein [Thermoplasmata archaeon]
MAAQPTPQYAPPAPSRPLGVAILAVLVGIFGFLLILVGALLLAGIAAASFLGVGTSLVGIGGLTFGVIVLIVGLIILGLALGLWHLRMWALVLTLIFVILELVSFGLAGNFVSLGFIFALILFIYLLAVHRHFR